MSRTCSPCASNHCKLPIQALIILDTIIICYPRRRWYGVQTRLSVCLCVSVSLRSNRKTVWAINTKLGTHILYSSRSARIDPEVKKSKVKVTQLRKPSRRTVAGDHDRWCVALCYLWPLPAWVCMSIRLPMFCSLLDHRIALTVVQIKPRNLWNSFFASLIPLPSCSQRYEITEGNKARIPVSLVFCSSTTGLFREGTLLLLCWCSWA